MSVGQTGENIASAYIESIGYSVLYRNFKLPGGEIDIVARDPSGILTFIEVKAMRPNSGYLVPEDNMTKAKLRKLFRACEMFVAKHPKLVSELGWRIDCVAVDLRMDGGHGVRHYEQIV